MFGMFREAKLRTTMFLETTDAVKRYSSVDLAKMPAKEQGAFGDSAVDLLYRYQKKSKYTPTEIIVSGWHTVLSESDCSRHSLHGSRLALVRGFADYLVSGKVIFTPDYNDERYFPPFFTSFVRSNIEIIKAETSSSGIPIQELLSKL